jgi:hypothetical protein
VEKSVTECMWPYFLHVLPVDATRTFDLVWQRRAETPR